jgi:hypothetical protein
MPASLAFIYARIKLTLLTGAESAKLAGFWSSFQYAPLMTLKIPSSNSYKPWEQYASVGYEGGQSR